MALRVSKHIGYPYECVPLFCALVKLANKDESVVFGALEEGNIIEITIISIFLKLILFYFLCRTSNVPRSSILLRREKFLTLLKYFLCFIFFNLFF